MTLTFHALWLLCAVAAVAFAARAAARTRLLLATGVGYLLALAWSGVDRLPDPELAGVVAALAALVYLFRPGLDWAAAASGGVLTGMLTTLVGAVGAPPPLAVGLVGLVVGVTVWLVRARPGFAPDVLQEDALLIVGLTGLSVAMLPNLLDGWQAAANLNVPAETARRAIPAWSMTLIVVSMLLGAVSSVWRRR